METAMFDRYHSLLTIYTCWLFHFLITQPVISQSKHYTWFEAQTKCREKNQSLTLWKNESRSFYWTGFYKKRSQWTKIIGCYAIKDIQNVINKTFELSISSPPLCQERCLQENIYLFGLQAMYNYMCRSYNTFFIIVSTTPFCLRCYGTISSIAPTNWTNAHMDCKKEGKMLPNLRIHTLSNETYFWTGHYTRLSEWIKIIGCFEETAVSTLTKMSYEMHFPSAGLCQEVCLASNYFVFGLQFTKCVCLEQIPEQRRRGANDCSLSCSVKTNLKFRNDCGGNKTYSLFKSGSKMENSAFTSNECLSIQCPMADKRFIENECNTSYAQVCNNTWYEKYKDWQSLSGKCKSNQNSYLLGDLDLTNPIQACTLIKEQFSSPSWIGIAKELYISNNGVINSMENIDKNPMRCMKCNSDNCTLADCKESNSFVCLKGPETTSTSTGTTTSTTPQGTVSTSTTSLGIATSTTPHGTVSTEHSSNSLFEVKDGPSGSNNTQESMLKKQDGNTTVMMTVVPFTVIIILGLIALLLVILWRRRQTKKTAETKNVQHEPDLPKHSEKSDHSLQNNYFVLEKTESYSEVNSTKDSKDKDCKSPHNACYDDYDHLGENCIKKDEEDTYHHAFFPSSEDESNYGIRNKSDERQMESPYSHTNTGAYHIALADNECNTISINA